MRLLLAAIVGAIGLASLCQTLAYVLRASDPDLAHALAPWDGRLAALLSEQLSGAEASTADRARSDRIAREALRQDGTAVVAVATLGLNAEVHGNVDSARRLFAYAKRLSRRDIRTQIWSVEDDVRRGEVAAALHDYDIALRTSQVAPDLMFPVLAAAIAQPPIRSALEKTLAGRPAWSGSFTDYLANNDPHPRAAAALFRGLRRAGVPVSEGAQATLIGSLVASDFFDDAWSFYATIRPGADRRASRDPGFTTQIVTPAAFDWAPVNDGSVSASIQRGGSGGVFAFSAPASVGGPLLAQVQMLPAGDYLLQGHSADVDQPEGSRPYWLLACRDGRELGRIVLPNSAQRNGTFAGRLTVPAGCPVQILSLVARPSDMVSGVSGQIDRVQLRPAR